MKFHVKQCLYLAFIFAIFISQSFSQLSHMEDGNAATNPSTDTAAAKPKPKSRYDFEWKEEKNEVVRTWEKTPGVTPPMRQTTTHTPQKHPGLEGSPGPSPAMGPNNATVKVYLWSDFQCPNCMRADEPLKYLSRKYPKDIQVIFKQNPIPSHKNAFHCALATLAAARQNRFWDMHDLLFKNIRQLGRDKMEEYAKQIPGMNMTRFRKDMEDKTLSDQVEYERALGKKLGLTGTPGFVIGGKTQMGWGSHEGIESNVKKAMKIINDPKSTDQQKEALLCKFEGYEC